MNTGAVVRSPRRGGLPVSPHVAVPWRILAGFEREARDPVMGTYTETSHQSWGSRMGGSIKSVLVGVVLFLAAFPLLFWNEGRAVERARQLDQGLGAVVSISPTELVPENEGKLVHVVSPLMSEETLTDMDFKVTTDALELRRTVEMFQVKEIKHTETVERIGGSKETRTTYEYKRIWSERLIDPDGFNQNAMREMKIEERNPKTRPYDNLTTTARVIRAGAFELSPRLKKQLGIATGLVLGEQHHKALPKKMRKRVKLHDGMFYIARKPAKPRVGDVRVKFQIVEPPGEVTIIAQQRGKSFADYPIDGADPLEQVLQRGAVSAEAYFGAEQESNEQLTWILRVVGFLMMSVGLFLIAGPLVTIADLLPVVGDVLAMGAFIVAAVFSLPFTLITIAMGWLFYRPIVAIPLLLFAAVNITLVFVLRRKQLHCAANLENPQASS